MVIEEGTRAEFRRCLLDLNAPAWVCPNHAVQIGCTPIRAVPGECQCCGSERVARYDMLRPMFDYSDF
jgi:hypothetical protein